MYYFYQFLLFKCQKEEENFIWFYEDCMVALSYSISYVCRIM